jgi:hypothetical protein
MLDIFSAAERFMAIPPQVLQRAKLIVSLPMQYS